MSKASILIVEDESIVAKDIRSRLIRQGYSISGVVSSGEEAVDVAEGGRTDLVLMDIMLKGEMDGIAAAEQIRGRFGIPVVFLTAFADETTLQRAKVTEPFGYLLKPFEERELHITIEIALYKHRAERAIRESEERYRTLVDKAPDGVLLLEAAPEAAGRIVAANPVAAGMHGRSVEELVGNAVALLLHPRQAEWLPGQFARMRAGEWIKEESLHRRADGTDFPVETHAGAVELGGHTFFLCFERDVTERKLLEEQLLQSQKMESIGRLASGIAHDFNNILNNVLGFASQLKKYTTDAAKVGRYASTIEKSAARGAELSSQLLSFARKGRRESVPTDVADLVEEVAALCTETFPRSITVTRSIEPGLRAVLGDRGELFQVLLNLSVNARDAVQARGDGAAGTVSIEARNARVGEDVSPQLLGGKMTSCVEIRVADTGVGVPDEIRDKIFDPFFTTKEQGRGTGLGLSVVYTTVRNHRGVLLMETRQGEGTTFRVFLPAADVPAPAQGQQRPAAPPPAPAGGRETVLVVDDEESMQDLAKEILEEQGYTVVIARTGAEAVQIYRDRGRQIALVILDLVMPGMDGGQTYLALKALNPDLKAFFCTGYMPDQIVSALLEEEHLAAIQKPFEQREFLTLVRRVLDERGAE